METQHFNAECAVDILNTEIQFNYMASCPNKRYTVNHIHSNLELHYITEGSTLYTLNFREKIEVYPGEWLLIGNDVLHEEHILTASGGYALGFSLSSVDADSPISVLQNMHYYKGKDDPKIRELLDEIHVEFIEKRTGYETCCKNLFSVLLVHICRDIIQQDQFKTRKEIKQAGTYILIDAFFNRVFGYEGRDLKIEELADQLHVSPRHINRILLDYYGVTFHEKLTATRIKFAEYLLTTTDRSIDEISALCGMTSACLFENFKKINHITPAKYRKIKKTDTN